MFEATRINNKNPKQLFTEKPFDSIPALPQYTAVNSLT